MNSIFSLSILITKSEEEEEEEAKKAQSFYRKRIKFDGGFVSFTVN